MAYDLGDLIPLAVQVYDNTQTLANPGAITLTITLPDATIVTPTPVQDGTGLYHYDYAAPQAGAYKAAWVATGANAAAYDDTFYVEPWASIVSLADAKAFLNITTSTNDEEIRSFVLAATTMVEEYTNRAFVSRSMTRRYSGLTGTDRINAPVGMTAVATVVENGVTLTPTVDYDLDPISAVLYRRSGTYYTRYWLPGILNISITGTVGSNTIPADVRHATLLLIEHLWDTQRGGMTTVLGQESADEYNPQASYSMPRRVAEILDNYQIPSIA